MWMERLYEKYGKKFDVVGPEEEDETFRRESEENIRKIYTRRFFDVDVLGRKTPDKWTRTLRGVGLTLFSTFCIALTFYTWYHCYHASCDECPVRVITEKAGKKTIIACDCANCVVNYIFNPKTHFEKCYYSLLFFNSLIVLYIFSIIKRLAFQIFRHSNIIQTD